MSGSSGEVERRLDTALRQARAALGDAQSVERDWRALSARIAAGDVSPHAEAQATGAGAGSSAAGGVAGVKLGAGLLGVVLVGGAAWLAFDSPGSRAPAASPLPAPPPRAVEVVPAVPMPAALAETAFGTAAEHPTAQPAPATARPRPASSQPTPRVRRERARPSTPPPVETRADPRAEMALIERARQLLDSAPDAALAPLREHAARFPSGMLKQERELMQIEALRALGRTAEAAEQARAFVREHPDSPHGRRLRELLSAQPQGEGRNLQPDRVPTE